MLFQLGDKIFSGLFAPHQMSFSGNEATYGELAIINNKPRIQLTGSTLEQLAVSIQLRADYCNPTEELNALLSWKANGTILPLVWGNGDYKNDYVIAGVAHEILQTFPDGTVIELSADITLVEYVVSSPAEAQAKEDRRNAMAVGDKQQVSRVPAQPKRPESEAHDALVIAQNQAWEAVNNAQNAAGTDDPATAAEKIKKSIEKAEEGMSKAKAKVMEAQDKITDVTGIFTNIDNTVDKLEELKNIFEPPISLNSVTAGVINMQTALRLISGSTLVLTRDLILRR